MGEAILRTQDYCYLSTPKHVRSFVGRFIYIYTDKGELQLTETHLAFKGKRGTPVTIQLDSVTDIATGHYSRWAKPTRLDYIAITYREGDSQPTVLLTPTRSWATTTWETNKVVAEWVQLLRELGDKKLGSAHG